MFALEFEQIHKRYGRAAAAPYPLRGASFTVPQGQLFALVGVNGAGKTTLLRCLLDLSRADSGTVAIFGVDSRELAARHHLAFLPERFVVPAALTGVQFLQLSCQLHNATYSQEHALQVTQSLELDATALTRLARSYSKGMTQKLGLASALLSDKPLLVLDEPMSGLDPQARACVKRALADVRSQGRTVFFTSHALADVTELADGMALLHQGVVAYSGAPAGLIEQTQTLNLEQAFLQTIGAVLTSP